MELARRRSPTSSEGTHLLDFFFSAKYLAIYFFLFLREPLGELGHADVAFLSLLDSKNSANDKMAASQINPAVAATQVKANGAEEVHLSSIECIALEQEYGAHK